MKTGETRQTLTGKLQTDKARMKELLCAEDILTYDFQDAAGRDFVCFFADALTDKELLSLQVFAPLAAARTQEDAQDVKLAVRAPELREEKKIVALADEVLAGNPVLLWEGGKKALIIGTKKVPFRAITEPPTDIAIKGPREGFIEDVKINAALVRRRLMTDELMMDTLSVGVR